MSNKVEMQYIAHNAAAKFIQSDALYTLLLGDHGAGKTTAGLMRILARHKDLAFQTWAVVRNTRKQLGYTVGRTIEHWCPEPYTVWKNGTKDNPISCIIYKGSTPVVHFDFFGVEYFDEEIDDFFERPSMYSGVWFDDVDRWPFDTQHFIQARTLIRASPNPSIQITSNFLPAEHWMSQMWQLYEELPLMMISTEKEQAQTRVRQQSEIFRIPDEENAVDFISPGYLSRCRDMKELL